MENKFVDFLCKLGQNQDIERLIQTQLNKDIKQLMILVADDFKIQKDPQWVNSLYEWKYLRTMNGGDKFYENIEQLKETGDQMVMRLYMISLKFGFKGCYQEFPRLEYAKNLNQVQLEIPLFHYSPFKSNFKHINSFPGLILVAVPLFLYTVYIGFEYYMIKSLTRSIIGLYFKVIK